MSLGQRYGGASCAQHRRGHPSACSMGMDALPDKPQMRSTVLEHNRNDGLSSLPGMACFRST